MNRKILYVEDDHINAFILERLLCDFFTMTHVSNGESCMELLETARFDLILMDINLGGGKMDGVTTLKQIRTLEALKTVPVLAITSYAMPEDEQRFLKEGFDGYMAKPLYREPLVALINKFLV